MPAAVEARVAADRPPAPSPRRTRLFSRSKSASLKLAPAFLGASTWLLPTPAQARALRDHRRVLHRIGQLSCARPARESCDNPRRALPGSADRARNTRPPAYSRGSMQRPAARDWSRLRPAAPDAGSRQTLLAAQANMLPLAISRNTAQRQTLRFSTNFPSRHPAMSTNRK